jgi:exodeoxyribonuclease VII small subunit
MAKIKDPQKAGLSESPAPSFEEAFKRLSEIVEVLESGEGTLTEMTTIFEEGILLSKICEGHLDSIEQKVEILLGAGSEDQAVPYEGQS